jgi:hypothetical protein
MTLSTEILKVIIRLFSLAHPLIVRFLIFASFLFASHAFLLKFVLLLFLLRLPLFLLFLFLLPLGVVPFSLLLPLSALIFPGFALTLLLACPRAEEVRVVCFSTLVGICLLTLALLKR